MKFDFMVEFYFMKKGTAVKKKKKLELVSLCLKDLVWSWHQNQQHQTVVEENYQSNFLFLTICCKCNKVVPVIYFGRWSTSIQS